jgi:hypothetical protein
MSENLIGIDQIKPLIGPPPLVMGESEQEYWLFCSEFIKAWKVKTIPDAIEVYELAQKYWEQNRLRKCSSALVKSARPKALGVILARVPGLSDTEALAQAYFDTSSKDHEKARGILTKCGITEHQIVAEAMEKRSEGLLLFDRMESYRASASRSLRKDIDRRSQSRNEPSEQAGGG